MTDQEWLDGVIGNKTKKVTNNTKNQSSGRVGSAIIGGVGNIISRVLGNENTTDVNQANIEKEIKVQQAKLDSERNAQLIQALGNVRGPMSLLTNVIGIAVANKRRPTIKTSDESSGNANNNSTDKGGNYESEETGVQGGQETRGSETEWKAKTPEWLTQIGERAQKGWNSILKSVGVPIE